MEVDRQTARGGSQIVLASRNIALLQELLWRGRSNCVSLRDAAFFPLQIWPAHLKLAPAKVNWP